MAHQEWIEQLEKVFAQFESPETITPSLFWERLQAETSIKAEARRLFGQRLNDKYQTTFLKDLRNIIGQASVDSQTRRKSYRNLAQFYNCIFQWVEDKNPGDKPDDFVITS